MSKLLFLYGILLAISIKINPSNYWVWHLYGRWALTTFMGCLAYSWWVAGQLGSRQYFPLIAWVLASGVYIGLSPFSIYQREPDLLFKIAMSKDAVYGTLLFTLSTLFIACRPDNYSRVMRATLRNIFFLSLGYTLLQYKEEAFARGAFMGNASMNGCLIACLFPFGWETTNCRYKRGILLAVTLLAISMTDASQPYGCLGIVLAVMAYRGGFLGVISLRVCALIVLLILGLGYSLQGMELFNTSGRFAEWPVIISGVRQRANIFFGSGFGSSAHLISAIQMLHLQETKPLFGSLYLWYHSDWLQMFMELGIIGFSFVCWTWWRIVHTARHDVALISSLLGFSVCGLFNYPMHLAPSAVSIVLLIGLIIKKGD